MVLTIEMIGAVVGFIGLTISLIWNLRNFYKVSKDEAQNNAVRNANIETRLIHIADDVKEIKIQQKTHADNFSAIKTEMEVVKKDLQTLFTSVDDMKGMNR